MLYRIPQISQISSRYRLRHPWRIADEALAHGEPTRSGIRRTRIVVLIDNGMDHDGLFVDRNGRVGGDCHPIVCRHLISNPRHRTSTWGSRGNLTSLERQRFACHEHDVGPFIPPFHLVLARSLALLPARAGGKVQGRGFVGGAAHVPGAHDTVTVRHGEV